MIFVGIDWSETHHDVCVIDADGKVLAKGRVPEGVEGLARLHELVSTHTQDPSDVAVGIELDRGLLVGALVASGYAVHAINPLSVDRYRDRAPREPNPIPGTRRCWRTWSAPIATCTGRWPGTPSWPKR